MHFYSGLSAWTVLILYGFHFLSLLDYWTADAIARGTRHR